MRLFDSRSGILMVSLFAVLSTFVIELIFGLISNSLALITDSINALMDAMVIVVLIIAARIAMRPASAGHAYGYGKLEPLGGMFGGIAAFIFAAFLINESIHRLQGPPPDVLPSIIGLVGGIYTMGIDFFRVYILRRALKRFGGHTLMVDLHHTFMCMGSTTVAVVGIVLASTGLYFVDLVAAMVLGVLLATTCVKLVYKAALDLTDVTVPKMVSDVKHAAESVPGVVRVGPALLRRSGDTVFANVTLAVRGDTSFDKAHQISEEAKATIKQRIVDPPPDHGGYGEHGHGRHDHDHGDDHDHIKDASITIHLEPDWENVPIDSKIIEIAKAVGGERVRGASHVSTHKAGGKLYADLHVKVDKDIPLTSTYEISNKIESDIKDHLPGIERTTIRLEPFDEHHEQLSEQDIETEELIRTLLNEHPEILGTIRITSLKFDSVYKIDIDCMLDGEMTVEEVHHVLTGIEDDIRAIVRNSIITIHPVPV